MSKIIKLTEEYLEEARKKFEELLAEGKFTDGKISYTYNFSNLDRKANLIFSELAWHKMNALVNEFSTEIAWSGIAYREDDDDYYVKDIIVFPQLVTGATVERDITEYAKWGATLDDETFSHMRMHGHSHVNMGVSPSPTDTSFYNNEILAELSDSDFYIFMIINKKGDSTIKIYDYGKNIFFDTSDIDLYVKDDGIGIREIVRDAKEKVKDKPAEPVKTGVTYQNTYKPAKTGTGYTASSYQSESSKEDESKRKYKRKETSYTPTYSYYDDDAWDRDYNGDYSYYGYGYMRGRW